MIYGKDTIMLFNQQQRGTTNIVSLSKDRLFTVPAVIFMRHDTCLQQAVNDHLKQYAGNGLLKQWALEYIPDYRESLDVDGFVPLGMSQLMGPFDIMSVSIAMTILVFVWELYAGSHPGSRAEKILTFISD